MLEVKFTGDPLLLFLNRYLPTERIETAENKKLQDMYWNHVRGE